MYWNHASFRKKQTVYWFSVKLKNMLRCIVLKTYLNLNWQREKLNSCHRSLFPIISPSTEIVATDKEEVAFKDLDAAILVGSMPRKEGMERKDLLKANVAIFKSQGLALEKYAKKTVKVETTSRLETSTDTWIHGPLELISVLFTARRFLFCIDLS